MRTIEEIHEDERRMILKNFDLDAIAKKRAELKAQGVIADKLEELNCKLHEGSKFDVLTGVNSDVQYAACHRCLRGAKIESTFYGTRTVGQILSGGKSLDAYYDREFLGNFKGTMAYNCKLDLADSISFKKLGIDLAGCGWVFGQPVTKITERARAYSRHITPMLIPYSVADYSCGICGIHLGTHSDAMRGRVY